VRLFLALVYGLSMHKAGCGWVKLRAAFPIGSEVEEGRACGCHDIHRKGGS